jgi:hypothetical protein
MATNASWLPDFEADISKRELAERVQDQRKRREFPLREWNVRKSTRTFAYDR